MKYFPSLTIITINLNNSEGLLRTIESVLIQTFKKIEFIIIDGKSSDNSIEIIKKNQSQIDYWTSEPDTGIYNAMNKGIRAAKGEYCLFLNSGDWLVDHKVLDDFEQIQNKADIISGDVYYYDSRKKGIQWEVKSPEVLTAKTLFLGTLPHQATFIKRDLFERFGIYDETLKITSDWLFWIKTLLENNCTYQHINRTISYFNMDGISCQNDALPKIEQKQILESKYPRFIADYTQLKDLEKEKAVWGASKEFKVFEFLKRIGFINFGVFFYRVFRYIKRKF